MLMPYCPEGLSLREYLAGCIACGAGGGDPRADPKEIAARVVAMADALAEELAETDREAVRQPEGEAPW